MTEGKARGAGHGRDIERRAPGLAWIGAFALFVVLYGPLLAGRRRA